MTLAFDTEPPLPAALARIRQEVEQNRSTPDGLSELCPIWADHVSLARAALPEITIEHDGETIYIGRLSPGCLACKQGEWDCLFVTMRCNLDCRFCYSPRAIPRGFSGSSFGATCEQIAAGHSRTRISGVSFSGGEPFLEPDRLLAWVSWFKERFPEKYYWVYTNGVLASPDVVRRLAEAGLDEIRFNMAATGYRDPKVLANVEAAARLLPCVTVEIPAIPEDAGQVLAALEPWVAAGVKCLNLHELIYEPGTPAADMPGARRSFVTPDGHHSQLNPDSRALTLVVMQEVGARGLALSVNDCSLQNKLRQLRGRRRSLAPLLKAPHEVLLDDDRLASCCAYLGEETVFFPPPELESRRRSHPTHRFARLERIAPMSVHDGGRWVSFELL